MEKKKEYITVYDREARVYDSTRSFYEIGYGGVRERKLLSLFCRGPFVLNLACGTGRLLPFLCENCFEVVGIDLSAQMLNMAKTKTTFYGNLHLVRCDAELLPFREGVFDDIVCSRAFKFFPNPLKALTEGAMVLRKDGKVVFSMETSDPLWIRIGYRLKIPYMGARFEWRYRVRNIGHLFEKAKFKIIFIGCVFFFGKTVYQTANKYFRPGLKLLELIDSHSRVGRNVMIVGTKISQGKISENMMSSSEKKLFIHFFGADGAGKTTQAQMLTFYLRENGAKVKLIRIRSGRTIASLLYRFFVRINSHLIEKGGDGRVIRMKIIRNKLDEQIWSWLEFMSMIPWLIRGVYIPLLVGKTVIAERYIIDAIATIAYIIDNPKWGESFLARLMLRFIPSNTIFIHLDAPYAAIRKRKGNFVDPVEYIEFQRKTYLIFARAMKAIFVNTSNRSKEETHRFICQHLKGYASFKILTPYGLRVAD